jgi:hypothetical protein
MTVNGRPKSLDEPFRHAFGSMQKACRAALQEQIASSPDLATDRPEIIQLPAW